MKILLIERLQSFLREARESEAFELYLITYLRRTGLPRVRFCNLRRAVPGLALQNGVDNKTVFESQMNGKDKYQE